MDSPKEKDWRLIRNIDKGKYCFLIGANSWAIELQEHEFDALYDLLNKLINQFLQIEDQIMDEESINIEIEKLPWYGELEGIKSRWSLKIIFESNEQTRSFEMFWPSTIAKHLFNEMRKMWESMHSNN